MKKYLLRTVAVTGVIAGCLATQPAFALTLEEALEHTYTHNPSIHAARKELEATNERMAQSLSNWRPNASFSFQKGREETKFNSQPETRQDTEDRTLRITQPLFRGGGSIANYKSTDAQIEAQQNAYVAVEQDTLLNAAVAYVDVIRARELVKLTKKNENVLRRHLTATSDRFDVGEVTKTDVSQANSRLARTTSDRVEAEGALISAGAAFARIIRMDVPAKLSMSLPNITIPDSLEEALAKSEQQNPTLVQAQLNVESAKYNMWEQRSNILPTVDLVGESRTSEGGISFNGQNFDNDSLVVSVNVPLYQSGRAYSIARQAARQREQRKQLAFDTQNRVKEAVISAWERLLTTKAIIVSSEQNIQAGQTALEGVEQENLYGARTTLDVLDAEQELFEAEVELVTAQRNEAVAVFNLANLLGDFTAQSLELDVDYYDMEKEYRRTKYKFIGF